jgi:magnesium-transporting ATPase (P-type)
MAARRGVATLRGVDPPRTHAAGSGEPSVAIDPEESIGLLVRDLGSSPSGLTGDEASRRLLQYGPNLLQRRGGVRWPAELAAQLTHPLALLLWAAALLSLAVGNTTVAVAVVLVIVLNAAFALVQELEAERAVEAIAGYLPQRATAVRDGDPRPIDVAELVPGDIVEIDEGERVPADIRLIDGAIVVDMSMLTGESVPVRRSAELVDVDVPRFAARDLAFMGSSCLEGEARGIVFATGMHTEIGRIASLSQTVRQQRSPLERQVRRVAWLIAAVAVTMAVAFVPVAVVAAGLSLTNAIVFAAGLLAGNVPEGMLPVITLALAVAVRSLAKRGAVVKRLSAVETLGSTDVICTDKTGTLTQNRMEPVKAWTPAGEVSLRPAGSATETNSAPASPATPATPGPPSAPEAILAVAALLCNNARTAASGAVTGDPTDVALRHAAHGLVAGAPALVAGDERIRLYHFDPHLKLMSTVDRLGGATWLHAKGAPESILTRCSTMLDSGGAAVSLSDAERRLVLDRVAGYGGEGMRVIALARRPIGDEPLPERRETIERDLTLIGLVALEDPPRPEVAAAVASCHRAGITIHVITGDHPLTAAAIAQRVGIGGGEAPRTVMADALERMPPAELAGLLARGEEIVFARATPEAKLLVAETLQKLGHIVAMTGDGVNDAPALHRADIGVAMGLSGTEVAREAATMVLADDDFTTIVAAVEAGRRVYDNVRKFIVYIFAHATPEVVPFLVFALSGGLVPPPLTVPQLLAFDVGSETLPSLALGRDPAEPGIMDRPPRPADEGVIRRPMLVRAWLFLGVLVAALELAGFFFVLAGAGWHPGDPVGTGQPLHHAYLQATTMSLVGMMAGQIGTAFAVRTRRESLRSIGVFSNPQLLVAIAGVIALGAAFIYAPPFHVLLGTAALPARDLLFLLPYPVIVWGADEIRRWLVRRHTGARWVDSPNRQRLATDGGARPGG